jgi:hypothetical protein
MRKLAPVLRLFMLCIAAKNRAQIPTAPRCGPRAFQFAARLEL